MPAALSNTAVWKAQTRDLRTDLDLTRDELSYLLELAEKVKSAPARYATALTSRYLTLLFEKPSLRTRLTFELAIKQLGGDCVVSMGTIGDREPLKDIARNLDRWTNCIVARVFKQNTIDDLAALVARAGDQCAERSVSSLSGVSGHAYDPKERFATLKGLKLAFVGDGNNVAHSLMLCCARLGMNFALACPAGYEPNGLVVDQATRVGEPLRRDAHRHDTTLMRRSRSARTPSTPTYGPAWGRNTRRSSGAKIFAAVPGERGADGPPTRHGDLHALPARQARRGSDRWRDRVVPARWSSTRPRTGCTRKRRCC